MTFSESTGEVIALATAIRDYWDRELPKRHPNYPLVGPGEDSGPPPPESKKLRNILISLPEDDIYKLLLLMHLGRGDIGTHDLAEHFETLKGRFPKLERAVAQLVDKAPLADYLAAGLVELNQSGLSADDLPFASINSVQ